ncbi:hypothetical protein ACTHQ6_00285 [Arthrobacter sp. SAFR-179]
MTEVLHHEAGFGTVLVEADDRPAARAALEAMAALFPDQTIAGG